MSARQSMYMYLSSNHNKIKFKNNSPSLFVNIISDRVNFTGVWEVAVIDMMFHSDQPAYIMGTPQTFYILCDFVKKSYTPVSNASILKRVYSSDGKWAAINQPIINPEYHELSVTSLSVIKLYITDDHFNPLQMPLGLLAVTLHFRQK